MSHQQRPFISSHSPRDRTLTKLVRSAWTRLATPVTRWAILAHSPIYGNRIQVLCDLIGPHLYPGDQVLDIGCGSGTLGRGLMERNPAIHCRGLEIAPRDGCAIEVLTYDGHTIPFTDSSVDVAILADVVHHAGDPLRLIQEAARVARRLVIVKDHVVQGLLALWRLRLLDWAANRPYGIPCTYRYYTVPQWHNLFAKAGLVPMEEHRSLSLYPFPIDVFFGRRLQYLVFLKKFSTVVEMPSPDEQKS